MTCDDVRVAVQATLAWEEKGRHPRAQRSFHGEADLTVFVGHRYVPEVINCDKKSQLWLFCCCQNVEFVTSGPYLCPTKTVNFASPYKTAPIISGNFVMKIRFACADQCSTQRRFREYSGVLTLLCEPESPESSLRIFLSGLYVPHSQWG